MNLENIKKTIEDFKIKNPDKQVTRSCLSKDEKHIMLWYLLDDKEYEIELEILGGINESNNI